MIIRPVLLLSALENLNKLINNDFFNAFSLVHIIMWSTVLSP